MERLVTTYADGPLYKIELEMAQTPGQDVRVFVHCEVYKWSKSVALKIRKDVENIFKKSYDEGIDFIFSYNQTPKQVKFCELINPYFTLSSFNRGKNNLLTWDLEELGYGS